MALRTPGPDGGTPLQLLADGQYGKAYIMAMDVLVGRRSADGDLLNATQVRRPSRDTRQIFDENDDVD
jgi:hypothetical protein